YPVVTIKNVGKEKILLKLDNNSLTIKKVKLSGDKIMAEETYNPSYYETVSSSVDESSKRLKLIEVPVDGERSIPYAVKVKNSGVYYITFSARPYFEEGKREVDEHELVWFSAEYKNVQ
ncbi:hypothetical protein LZ319_12855, partial [Serratia ureilytica]|nr:hypothetical protein [Serratia ureilytica]